MTAKQIEATLYEWNSFIADKIRDIQASVRALKDPEDYIRNNHCFNQIENAIADIRNARAKIEELQDETPEEEDSGNDYTGASFLNSLKQF